MDQVPHGNASFSHLQHVRAWELQQEASR